MDRTEHGIKDSPFFTFFRWVIRAMTLGESYSCEVKSMSMQPDTGYEPKAIVYFMLIGAIR